MNLRRKLLTTFGVLALLGLTIVGVTFWVILQWQSSSEDLNGHYLRSLEVQRIQAATLEATREVPDALGDEDPDAGEEFEDAIAGVDREFELWADLAENEEEMRQVRDVRDAYDTIVGNSREFFDLLESGRREEAARLSDTVIEEENFDAFQRATEAAIVSDREKRDVVQANDREVRRTAQLVLIIAAFGTVSLLFLLAAYLVSDMFRPLREVEDALGDVGRGDLNRRLDAERADELGAVNAAFNGMVESLTQRERMGGLASSLAEGGGADGEPGNGSAAWRNAPSRVTLHRLVSQLRTRVAQLNEDGSPGAAEEQRELISQLDGLSQAVARVTEFGFPLDLDLSRTDVRALLYRVFMRFGDEFAERAVSLDLEIAPEVGHAVVDKLKLREAVAELLRNALDALPESGGHLGLRSRLSEGGTELLIEVADDGAGAEQFLIDRAFEPGAHDDGGRPRTGLTLTKAVVEQHGGRFGIESEPGEGTYAQIRLPLRG